MTQPIDLRIFDFLADGIFIVGRDYKIRYMNKSLKESYSDGIDKLCYKHLHGNSKPCSSCQNDRVFAGETVQWEWTDKNGRMFDIMDTPFIYTDGTACKIEVLRDITEARTKKERDKLLRELKRKESQLQSVARDRVDAQEEERRRISRELHDGLGQSLSALKIALVEIKDSLSPKNLYYKKVDRAIDIVSHSLSELRRISHDLRPPMLDDLGFVSTVYWLADRLNQSTNVRINFFPHSIPKNVPKQVDVTLFRVVQEALTNIVKHSQASQANVLLKESGPCLQVEIFDNGIGFDPSSVLGSANLEKGIGLVSMRERVELLGGDMIVRSELGKGTTISVRVPVKETKGLKRKIRLKETNG